MSLFDIFVILNSEFGTGFLMIRIIWVFSHLINHRIWYWMALSDVGVAFAEFLYLCHVVLLRYKENLAELKDCEYNMEEGRTELEFDEFEKLLGEIPNATSVNPHSEESGIKSVSLNGSLSPICVNSYKRPLSEKLHNNGRRNEGKNSVKKIQKSPVARGQPEVTNLPDDRSLTSAFAGLSFDGGVTMEAGSHEETCKSMQNFSFSLNGQIPNSLKTRISDSDAPVMVVPSFQAPNNTPCGFYEFDVTNIGQESSNMSKFNSEELKKPQVVYSQPMENLSSAVPLAHAVQGFQFLSNVPGPGLQFPLTSDPQQFFLDAQSRIPYLRSQQLNQNQVSWRNMEEEQYYRMQQRYVYMQQLHDQRLEAQHLVQGSGNIASRLTCPNPRHPHFEVPISHRLEQSNQERGPHQSNPALSYTDLNGIQVFDKVGKQSFPEKILTRSHGMNTLKAVKFGAVGADESLAHVSHNGKVLSNGHFRHTLSTQNTGCFQLDSLGTWGMFPSLMHLKNTDMKALPQKYTDMKALPQKYNSMDEITGRIYLMAKDQHGAQKDVENIFFEIIDHIVELMTDPFGITSSRSCLKCVARTRAVQKVIETLKTLEQFSMVVSSLKPGIVTLIKNTNGNHVAQRCLQYLTPEYRETSSRSSSSSSSSSMGLFLFLVYRALDAKLIRPDHRLLFLFEAATTNCVELATDRHGCCVLQKCLSHSDAEQRNRLICEITSNALILSQDPFGNYVVQFVFELQLPWATVDILDQLEGEERRVRIVQELIENPRLDQIMQDPYGNYVIQAALSQSKVLTTSEQSRITRDPYCEDVELFELWRSVPWLSVLAEAVASWMVSRWSNWKKEKKRKKLTATDNLACSFHPSAAART
ncbi:pumilio 12 [Prunus dulcis]|uniref:Pumilio 12 n=1 Tax=Prunus dulcis TaxID=3755 RepID=A0A4Y1RK61_PRUDU|nr:pumilio 12 [Prunus dulcis]